MATNHTTNYQLNQWEATDQVLRTEFNQDNQKLDAALKANADGIAANGAVLEEHTAALAGKGNCQLQLISYVGDGTSSRTFTFNGVPRFIFILFYNGWQVAISGTTSAWGQYGNNAAPASAVWSGNSVTLSSNQYPCNIAGTAYQLIALIEQGSTS